MCGPDSLARIIDGQWERIDKELNSHQKRNLHAIRVCRTSSLGGKLYRCDKCDKLHYRYHSCRNRHCPACQNTDKQRWIQARQAKSIDCDYYHVVFTLPDKLNQLCLHQASQMYNMMFRFAWETLNGFGWNNKYLGAQIGATMVLHTWGSNLSLHPHIHCLVPGGGIDVYNRWKQAKGKGKYLFPVKAMSKVFRAKMLEAIKNKGLADDQTLEELWSKDWVVYAKPPFMGYETLLKYLARYTHKTAISHHRILKYDKKYVWFSYTNYRKGFKKEEMRLDTWEFVRRFSMHILPRGFKRIRHYGILGSNWSTEIFVESQESISSASVEQIWLNCGVDITRCPSCKKGKLQLIDELPPSRPPPKIYTRHYSL